MPKINVVPRLNNGYNKPLTPKIEGLKSFAPEEVAAIPPTFVTNIGPLKEPQNILDQLQIPACVAHAVTLNVMYHYWKKTGNYVLLSPRFLYAMCKTVDGLPADAGTYIETALQMAQKYGICEDSYFTNDTTLDVNTYTDASLIPETAFQNAAQYRIDSYDMLSDLSQTGLNVAMFNGGEGNMLVIGMDISAAWWTDVNGNVTYSADALLPLRPISATDVSVGGHCTNLYADGADWDAVNTSENFGLNQWGVSWAYQGRYCFGANDLANLYEAAIITATFSNTVPAPEPPQLEAQPSNILEEIVQDLEKVL
jgi:hypothetical protein